MDRDRLTTSPHDDPARRPRTTTPPLRPALASAVSDDGAGVTLTAQVVSAAAARLAHEVLGEEASVVPVGFVRNVVTSPDADSPWPVPLAHFTVWAARGTPRVAGEWVDVCDEGCLLRERHWWPRLAVASVPSERASSCRARRPRDVPTLGPAPPA